MTMRRTAADLTTRFRIEGLDTIRTRLTDFGNRIRQTMERVNSSQSMERVRRTIDGIRQTTERASRVIRTTFTESIRNAGRVASASFDRIGRSVSKVLGLVRSLISRLKGIGLAAAGIAGVAGLLSPVGLAAKVKGDVDEEANSIDRIRSQAQRQNLQPYQLDALEKIGRVGGIDTEGMAGLIDKLNESFGNLRPDQRLQQLQNIGRAYHSIAGTNTHARRKQFLIDRFGLENLDNAQRLMEQLRKQHGGLWTQIETERRKAGSSLISKRDLQIAEAYRRAMMMLQGAFEKLRRSIFRAFGPTVINWIRLLTSYIERNHIRIVARMIDAYNVFIIALRDVLKVFFGIETGWAVQHTWMIRVRDAIIRIAGAFGPAVKAAREWLSGLRDEFAAARAWVIQFGTDLQAVLSGRDYDVSGQNQWMVALKASAIETVATITGVFMTLYSNVAGVFSAIGMAWSQVAAGMNAAEFSETEGALYNIGAAVKMVYDWVSGLSQALYQMIALGQNAPAGFEWLNTVRDGVVEFYGHLKTAIGWLMGMINGLHEWGKQWGWDIKSSLLFVGLLSLTGAGGLLATVLGGILKIIGMVVPWNKAFTAMGAGVRGLMALASPWGIAIGYFIAATTLFYKLLENSPFNEWAKGITDAIYDVDGAIDRAGANIRNNFEQYGDKQASAAAYARSQRAAPYPAQLPYGDLQRYAASITTASAGSRPSSITNLRIDLGKGQRIDATTDSTSNEISGALRTAGLTP